MLLVSLQKAQVPLLRLAQVVRIDLIISQLDVIVAIIVHRLALYYEAWSSFDNRDGDNRPVLLKYLGHANLASQDSLHGVGEPRLPSPKNGGRTIPLTLPSSLAAILKLDFYINACRQIQASEAFNGLGSRFHDINEPLVRANLKLLPAILINER